MHVISDFRNMSYTSCVIYEGGSQILREYCQNISATVEKYRNTEKYSNYNLHQNTLDVSKIKGFIKQNNH